MNLIPMTNVFMFQWDVSFIQAEACITFHIFTHNCLYARKLKACHSVAFLSLRKSHCY